MTRPAVRGGGQAVEERSRVHRVGDLPLEVLPYPGKVELGRPRLEWGWSADAPSEALVPRLFQAEVSLTPW